MTQAAKSFDLYTDNPRMVPRQLVPTVLKMEMTVGKFQAQRFVTSPHDEIPLIVHLFAVGSSTCRLSRPNAISNRAFFFQLVSQFVCADALEDAGDVA